MKFRKMYDAHERVHPNLDPISLTHQSMAPECDINTIMRKYEKTGILEHRNNYEGTYGDFTQVPENYHESMNAVLDAQDMFQTLPATLRKRFHNDPGAFIEFANNPDNSEELIKLGLATKRADDVLDDSAPPATKKASTPPETPPKASKTPPEGD